MKGVIAMTHPAFRARYQARVDKVDSIMCVGLDPNLAKMPLRFRSPDRIADFLIPIVDMTHGITAVFKPNIAFFEAHGVTGYEQLKKVINHIRQVAPDVLILLDFKRADIDNTNNGNVALAFTEFGVDAVTVNPYLGIEAMKPFFNLEDKGFFLLCRTSNSGSDEFQNLEVTVPDHAFDSIARGWRISDEGFFMPKKLPLYQYVAYRAATRSTGWDYNHNCGLVVGATYPEDLREVRRIIGDDPLILLPGFGTQGGDVQKAITAGKNSKGAGVLANSSSAILYASIVESAFATAAYSAAIDFHATLNRYRKEP